MKKVIILFGLIVFLTCCVNISNKEFFLFFNTKGVKVTEKTLSDSGFERIWGVDLIMFEKKSGDTIINLDVDDKENLVSSKTWIMKLGSNDFKYVHDFMLDREMVLNAPIAYYDNSEDYYFTVISLKNDMYFCKVMKEEKEYSLYVTYHIPR
jgi:hypothetical protein